MKPDGPAAAGPSLRVKALAWLALREHSTHELRAKLDLLLHGLGHTAPVRRRGETGT